MYVIIKRHFNLKALSGQEFGQGFLIGAASSMAGSLFGHGLGENGLNANKTWSTVGTIGFSGAVGGVVAELTGGDFWKGAAIGVTIAALNHGANHLFSHAQLKKMFEVYKESVKFYDDPADFYRSIGGPLGEWAAKNPEDFKNTCAARLSKALNYSGFEIPKGTPGTYSGADGKYYFIQAKAMSAYLSGSKIWGAPRPVNHHNLRNGVFFQTGFGGGVSGHLDIMFRGAPAHHIYDKPTVYWH